MRTMLKIENLTATVGEEDAAKTIINGLSLEVPKGEVHAIMGPNGAGKSTLSYVLTGRDGYEVTGGSAKLNGEDILDMDPEERAAKGLFLSFQYPVEIPGVPVMTFVRAAMNSQRKARGEDEISAPDFLILDETDSGLDIDALKTVADGVNAMRSPDRGMLVITHYQRLLDHIQPDKVHVLSKGRIVATGGPELAHRLEKEGYEGILGEVA